MGTELELIIERLRKNKVDIINLLGCYGLLILSKIVFKKNIEASEFLNYIFKIKLPLYITKSRTLMAAKIMRMIYNIKDDEDKIECIIVSTIEELEKFNIKKELTKKSNSKKKHDENKKLEKWLKGL